MELARAGLFVYATGRSSRVSGRSEIDRPETIEETCDLIRAAGGEGPALVVDHENTASVAALIATIERESGRLDVLVNDIFGGDRYMEWDKPLWEHDWPGGLRMLQMGVHTHLITCRAAIPLMLRTATAGGSRGLVIEMTDGTSQANAQFRRNVGFYYDLVKANVERIVKGLSAELKDHPVTAVGVTPGWLRSEKMLDNFGVTEETWREACVKTPGFALTISVDCRRQTGPWQEVVDRDQGNLGKLALVEIDDVARLIEALAGGALHCAGWAGRVAVSRQARAAP